MAPSAAVPPSWLLTGAEGYVGDDVNERTAVGLTRKQLSIKATFFPSSPPEPSKLCVHCPDATEIQNPIILCIAGDLILFRVNISTAAGGLLILSPSSVVWREYFLYRAEPNRAMLELLPDPHPPSPAMFNDSELCILPRGDGDFTIAALVSCSLDEFELLLLHSNSNSKPPNTWTSMKLPVTGPPKRFPVNVVRDRIDDLSRHLTTNVVVIGGKHGTVGWVDLWRGVLLCDVLRKKPTLRAIPVPLPMDHIVGNNGLGFDFGRGMDHRGIAFIDGRLKFVQLDLSVTELRHVMDDETGFPIVMVHDWTITTYSNSKMSCSYGDWEEDGVARRSSEVVISDGTVAHSGGLLLLPPSQEEHGEMAARRQALHRLVVCDPSPSLGGDGVVYMVAKVKLWHPKSWLIALDMSSNTLQSVVPFVAPEDPYASVKYFISRQ